jgi:molybdopterin molybdotransferase
MGRTAAGTRVFSLPDTPSSCFWAYEALIGRAIRRLAGRDPALPFPRREMKLTRKIVSTIGVTEICPVQRRTDGSVEPLLEHAPSNLRMVTQADGFVTVGEGSEGIPADTVVPVHLFEGCATPHPQLRPGTGMP